MWEIIQGPPQWKFSSWRQGREHSKARARRTAPAANTPRIDPSTFLWPRHASRTVQPFQGEEKVLSHWAPSGSHCRQWQNFAGAGLLTSVEVESAWQFAGLGSESQFSPSAANHIQPPPSLYPVENLTEPHSALQLKLAGLRLIDYNFSQQHV